MDIPQYKAWSGKPDDIVEKEYQAFVQKVKNADAEKISDHEKIVKEEEIDSETIRQRIKYGENLPSGDNVRIFTREGECTAVEVTDKEIRLYEYNIKQTKLDKYTEYKGDIKVFPDFIPLRFVEPFVFSRSEFVKVKAKYRFRITSVFVALGLYIIGVLIAFFNIEYFQTLPFKSYLIAAMVWGFLGGLFGRKKQIKLFFKDFSWTISAEHIVDDDREEYEKFEKLLS
jgi:hypothetical protein